MGKELAKEWLKASYSDLLVIEGIIDNEFLTHMIAFHAQQSIEKSFKSLLQADDIKIPRIHKLQNLVSRVNVKIEIDIEILKILDELYIESRYPSAFGLLPYGKPTLDDVKKFYETAQSFFDEVCIVLDVSQNELIK